MSNILLIAPTTATKTSNSFSAIGNVVVTIQCSNLGPGETLTLQEYDISLDGGPGWIDYTYKGEQVQLTNLNNNLIFTLDNLSYKVIKSVTANPVGVAITSSLPLTITGV